MRHAIIGTAALLLATIVSLGVADDGQTESDQTLPTVERTDPPAEVIVCSIPFGDAKGRTNAIVVVDTTGEMYAAFTAGNFAVKVAKCANMNLGTEVVLYIERQRKVGCAPSTSCDLGKIKEGIRRCRCTGSVYSEFCFSGSFVDALFNGVSEEDATCRA